MIYLINILFIFLIGTNSNNNSVINGYLNEKLSDYNKFSYKIVSPKNIDLGKVSLDTSRELKMKREYAYVPVQLTYKGKTKNTVLTVKLKLYKNVLVATRKIRKREFLTKNDFKVMEKEISNLRDKPLRAVTDLNILRARINIAPESVLQQNMVEQIPDINIGDRVEAIYTKGIVNVNFLVTSRSEGVTGEVVKVKRDDNRIFKARVINNKTVKILE